MSRSAYNYDTDSARKADAQARAHKPVDRPVDAPPDGELPFPVLNVSAEGTPDARLQRPRHSLRHAGGRFRTDGMGGYDHVTQTWLPNVRDHSVLVSPIPRPKPSAVNWGLGPSVAETVAFSYGNSHICHGSECPYIQFHEEASTDVQ
jgi:hypothetical protein